MAHLEKHSYIHLNLAARNILVSERKVCKVAEIGQVKLTEEGTYNVQKGEKFLIKWTAPEAIKHNRLSIKSNVWSFGIVTAEVFARGAALYSGMSSRSVYCVSV